MTHEMPCKQYLLKVYINEHSIQSVESECSTINLYLRPDNRKDQLDIELVHAWRIIQQT